MSFTFDIIDILMASPLDEKRREYCSFNMAAGSYSKSANVKKGMNTFKSPANNGEAFKGCKLCKAMDHSV